MTASRRAFVTNAVALPIALAGLSSSRLAALAQAGPTAEKTAPDLGTYQLGASAEGVLALVVTLPNGAAGLHRDELKVLWHPSGAATLTVTSFEGRRRVRTVDLAPATAAAFFAIFTDEEDGAK